MTTAVIRARAAHGLIGEADGRDQASGAAWVSDADTPGNSGRVDAADDHIAAGVEREAVEIELREVVRRQVESETLCDAAQIERDWAP